jgi:DNA-binding transcriptional LysR family regulator
MKPRPAPATHRHHALTPEALEMVDTIARTGSFAAAARALGKVPSALTYNVRQLEEALDVLLFDRSSRQAQLTAAGTELLTEGRRLLQEVGAVANRVRRVACGWETQLSISVDDVISVTTVLEIAADFYALRAQEATPGDDGGGAGSGSTTRLKLRTDVLTGTWEALTSGQADLSIGVTAHQVPPPGIEARPLGQVRFVYCVAPHHPLATGAAPIDDAMLVQHRAVAVADTAQRLTPMTVNLLPGQDVLTVPTMRAKLEALRLGLGGGYLPEPLARPMIDAGELVRRSTARGDHVEALSYAWRAEHGPIGLGRALQWWLQRLEVAQTRLALLDRQAALRGASQPIAA